MSILGAHTVDVIRQKSNFRFLEHAKQTIVFVESGLYNAAWSASTAQILHHSTCLKLQKVTRCIQADSCEHSDQTPNFGNK